MLHSTFQEQDHIRKEAVQKLIHQFETHPKNEALHADLKQNHAFNPFSEQSKEMIYSMGNMRYFEICETKFEKLNKDRYDVLSIPNYVVKKGPSHGARHGNTERQRIYHAAHVSSKKAKKKGYKSIFDRFLNSPRYRESQNKIGWNEEHLRTLGCDCGRRSLLYRHSGTV